MATTALSPFLKGATGRNTRGLLRIIILVFIAAAAVSSRLFSVISRDSGFNWINYGLRQFRNANSVYFTRI